MVCTKQTCVSSKKNLLSLMFPPRVDFMESELQTEAWKCSQLARLCAVQFSEDTAAGFPVEAPPQVPANSCGP